MRVLFLLFYWLFFQDNNLFSELEITKLDLHCIGFFGNFVMKTFVFEG